jgi:SAM-dependent methyltransferase
VVDAAGWQARAVSETWDGIASWWVDAVRDDPGQSIDTHSIVDELLAGTEQLVGATLDLGCGEGQGMRRLAGTIVGVDLSIALLQHARSAGPVVQARLPDLSWARSDGVDRAVSIGLLDLIPDHDSFFGETFRVVRPGGHLVVVINHPVATSPDSESLVDPDGEILWRWGTYLSAGSVPQCVGNQTVELFHRPLGVLLSAAADVGWILEAMVERGPGAGTIDGPADMHGHEEIPTIAGFRWRSPAAA